MRILVPLDGSKESEGALRYASMLAPGLAAELELLRCYEPLEEVYTLPNLARVSSEVLANICLEESMLAYLEEKEREVAPLPCKPRLECGDPAGLILDRSEHADLVIMTRHGRRGLGRWLLGGVANKVARSSHKPVLVVASPHSQPRLEKIMVCLDGSEIAELALTKAASLAHAAGAKLILYRFVPVVYGVGQDDGLRKAESYLADVGLAYPDLVISTVARPTDGGSQIVATAAELDADLIVVGSEGRQGLARWLLGSVAEDALAHARCPLMIVHRDPSETV